MHSSTSGGREADSQQVPPRLIQTTDEGSARPAPQRPHPPMDGRTHARLLGESGLETLVAAAVIGAGGVGADPMVAGAAGAFVHVCRQSTLSPSLAGCAPHPTQPPLTNALPPDVLLVAHVTLAAVAGRGGQAAAIQAQVGEVSADINGLVQGGCACNRDNGASEHWLAPSLESGSCLWVQALTLRLGSCPQCPDSLILSQNPALDSDSHTG